MKIDLIYGDCLEKMKDIPNETYFNIAKKRELEMQTNKLQEI